MTGKVVVWVIISAETRYSVRCAHGKGTFACRTAFECSKRLGNCTFQSFQWLFAIHPQVMLNVCRSWMEHPSSQCRQEPCVCFSHNALQQQLVAEFM